MTLTMDVSEAKARFDELLAAVEAGGEVVIARGTEQVARVLRVPTPVSPEDRRTAIDAILEMRGRMPTVTAEEIIAWRDEGRR